MAQLIVRQLDDRIAERLKRRARQHGVSSEEEHRRILRKALLESPAESSFREALLSIPPVGEDADFERIPQPYRETDF